MAISTIGNSGLNVSAITNGAATLTLPTTSGTILAQNASAPANSLVVDSSGNVGIGTGSPAQKLQVAGNIAVQGSTSGTVTLSAPAVAGSTVLTLPATSGTVSTLGTALTSATAQASTSETSIDFTGIPSWAKRITVMFSGVSTSGTSGIRFQLMVGGVAVTTNYNSASYTITNAVAAGVTAALTNGFSLTLASASSVNHGQIVLCQLSSNAWTGTGSFFDSLATERIAVTTGRAFSVGTVDGIRVTTNGGTDTFDAGTINIMYE